MIKRAFLFLTLLSHFFTFAQIKLSKGTIAISSGQKIDFTNLRQVDDQVQFTNAETKGTVMYFLNSVKYIEDESKSLIFGARPEKKPQVIKATDTIFKDFPEGIYKTKEDFLNRKPAETLKLKPMAVDDYLEKEELATIGRECFFYYSDSDTKVKKVFAVIYEGKLFFQVGAILANRNKTDRAQTNDFPNSFLKVLNGGLNYYYMEGDLDNLWAKGVASQGGLVGVAIEKAQQQFKGVVWDIKNSEFNIFKNCIDYNNFIKGIYPEGAQECDKQQPDLAGIHKAIDKVK